MPQSTPFKMRLELLQSFMIAAKEKNTERLLELKRQIYINLTRSETDSLADFFKKMIIQKNKVSPNLDPKKIDIEELYNQTKKGQWTIGKLFKRYSPLILAAAGLGIAFACLFPYLKFLLLTTAALTAGQGVAFAVIVLLPVIAVAMLGVSIFSILEDKTDHTKLVAAVEKIQKAESEVNFDHPLCKLTGSQSVDAIPLEEGILTPVVGMVVSPVSTSLVALSSTAEPQDKPKPQIPSMLDEIFNQTRSKVNAPQNLGGFFPVQPR